MVSGSKLNGWEFSRNLAIIGSGNFKRQPNESLPLKSSPEKIIER